MKIFLTAIFILLYNLFFVSVCSAENTVYGTYTAGRLTITSYTESWDEEKLQKLYIELISNLHGSEFDYLSNIYLFPDSPHGVNGYYYDDIRPLADGYEWGENAYIELYNAQRLNTPEKIAPTLAHEYGHHYTIYNITKYENKYYTQWDDTEFAQLRNLAAYPVIYNYNDVGYVYYWDVTEIAAVDYVQFFASSAAKVSIDFPDGLEMLHNGLDSSFKPASSFNIAPQNNPNIPLAAEIPGLYEYMLKIAGFSSYHEPLTEKSHIEAIQTSKNIIDQNEYTITWSDASGNEPFEYTVVMYPSNNPFVPYAVKTTTTGEENKAVFGSVAIEDSSGGVKSVSHIYEGEYIFKIHIKDAGGFIYSSEPFLFDFGYNDPDNYIAAADDSPMDYYNETLTEPETEQAPETKPTAPIEQHPPKGLSFKDTFKNRFDMEKKTYTFKQPPYKQLAVFNNPYKAIVSCVGLWKSF